MEAIGWLVLLAVLILIEIATLGLTTIWFAGGSLIAFIASMLGAPLWLQVVLMLVISLVLLIFTRPVALRYFNKNRVKTNYEEIVGKEGKVTERIDNFNQTGTVVVGGQEWTARSLRDDLTIEVESKVIVREIRGVKLMVEQM